MSRRYIHFSARGLEDAILGIHGLKNPKEDDGLLKLVRCPRCKAENPPGTVYRHLCSFILDKETAIKIEEEKRKRDEEIIQRLENLAKRLETLEEKFPEPLSRRRRISS
ncbi:hypothetical protein J7L00_01640 [Candidatus Bathyarchaeota archaeon]|nr:hypothetical protein [Candidatus Bathyarchaeota archaeon]